MLGFGGHAAVSLICWGLWLCGCQSDMLGFDGHVAISLGFGGHVAISLICGAFVAVWLSV